MVKPGGVIILVGENPECWGDEPAFEEWMTQLKPAEAVSRAERRELFSLGAHGARLLAQPIVEKGAAVLLVTSARMCEAARGSFVQAMGSIDEALAEAHTIAGADASVAVIRRARRVIVSGQLRGSAQQRTTPLNPPASGGRSPAGTFVGRIGTSGAWHRPSGLCPPRLRGG